MTEEELETLFLLGWIAFNVILFLLAVRDE
jgi:hypothetical protein